LIHKQRERRMLEPPTLLMKSSWARIQSADNLANKDDSYKDAQNLVIAGRKSESKSRTEIPSSLKNSNTQSSVNLTNHVRQSAHKTIAFHRNDSKTRASSNETEKEGRYRSFASMKNEKNNLMTIKDYQNLRKSHIGYVTKYL
jgi:hypothetical protein